MKHSVSVLYHSVSIFDCKISVESLNQSHFPHNCTFTHHFKLKYSPFLNWKIQISYKLFYCFFPDWETKEYEFVNGEIFTVGWGRKDGVMHSNCTTQEPNKMICISEERKKGWKIIDESTFSTVCVFAKLF